MSKDSKPAKGGLDVDIVIEAEEKRPLTKDLQEEIDPFKTGFYWYKPPLADDKQHSTAGHNWTISGHDMQVWTSTVPAGEQVICEVGSFLYMAPFMTTQVELTGCGNEGCSRMCGGESCVKVLLINGSNQEGYVVRTIFVSLLCFYFRDIC